MNYPDLLQTIAAMLTALGGFEFVKWLCNRGTEKRLNALEVQQKAFSSDAARIEELHASIDKANRLNDDLLQRISNANAALDKHIDRSRELSDRLYKSEQEVNRVNDALTAEQRRTAALERRLGISQRLTDHYRGWRCERPDCQDPRGRRPPNPKLVGKQYEEPDTSDASPEDAGGDEACTDT